MIKVKFFNDLSKGDDFFRFVDFVSDTLDLVVDRTQGDFDSEVVQKELERCACVGPWTMVDGEIFTHSGIQYVTVAVMNAEDYVKLKLFAEEIKSQYAYTKEDLLC